MNPIGIMQGRLSPRPRGRVQAFPWQSWKEEFELARTCGFDAIEWLVTAETPEANPISTDASFKEIRRVIADTGVAVPSLCADYLVSRPLLRVTEAARRASIALLNHLIAQSARLEISVVVVPVLEAGEVRNDADASMLLESLEKPVALAGEYGICLALESNLPAADLREVLNSNGNAALGVNYDAGNAAALGYDVVDDLRTLGSRLYGFHIKDRKLDGTSVELGGGDADFSRLFAAIATAGYEGPLILETPAGDDAVKAATSNLEFVRDRLRQSQSAPA